MSQESTTPRPQYPEESTQDNARQLSWRDHFDYSARAGLWIGCAFAVGAISLLLSSIPLLPLLLTLASLVGVPVLMVMTAIRYRDRVLGGRITYLRTVSFMTWSYLCALVISAVVYYTSFSLLFSDPSFSSMLDNTFATLLNSMPEPEMRQQYEQMMSQISPRFVTLNLVGSQLFLGLIFMYISALFVRK